MNNIFIVIASIVAISALGYGIYIFFNLSKDKQLALIKEWLLFAVINAEKALGNGTGKLKLRYVYDMFLDKFPIISKFISFENFSLLVDEALEVMREMIETNQVIKQYVEE